MTATRLHGPGLAAVLALCLATELVYRPCWFMAGGRVDPPVLFLFWLALIETRGRVQATAALIGLVRSVGGIEDWWVAWIPAALAAEVLLGLRRFVDLRDPGVRPVLVLVGAFAFFALETILSPPVGWPALSTTFLAGGVSALSALILFPILDAVEPVVASSRHSS